MRFSAFSATEGCRSRSRRSSSHAIIRAVLERLRLDEVFSTIHSAEEEPHGKPHPGVYSTTATRLGMRPEHCLAFEDSPLGVRAAKAAGMRCVAVPNHFAPPPVDSHPVLPPFDPEPPPPPSDRVAAESDRAFGLADLVLNSLADFDAHAWEVLNHL